MNDDDLPLDFAVLLGNLSSNWTEPNQIRFDE